MKNILFPVLVSILLASCMDVARTDKIFKALPAKVEKTSRYEFRKHYGPVQTIHYSFSGVVHSVNGKEVAVILDRTKEMILFESLIQDSTLVGKKVSCSYNIVAPIFQRTAVASYSIEEI